MLAMARILLFVSLVVCINAQISRFGSPEAAQAASDILVFFLRAPGNCLTVHSDLPLDAPSKNLAALWIRAAFHDSGTWDPSNRTAMGGADNSLSTFVNMTDNAGLPNTLAPRFMQDPRVNMSQADMIALGAIVSIAHCGGPNIPFRPGRLDTSRPTSPIDRLPGPVETVSGVKGKLLRMGWSPADMVALVIGSHSMG
jgi:catalase (peroxidase I)